MYQKRRFAGRMGMFILFIVSQCLVTSCQDTSLRQSQEQKVSLPTTVIVDTTWVKRNLDMEGLVVVDARTAEEYRAGHIPGAVSLPTKVFLDPKPENSRNVAPPEHVAALLGNAGITNSSTVVIYDGENYREATRVFWVLELHGHSSVAVLNGGFPGWTSQGFPVATDTVTPKPVQFVSAFQPNRLATREDVAQAIKAERATVIDSRSGMEYLGVESRADRAGHIPTAVNVDFHTNFMTADGVCNIKSPDELLSAYTKLLDDSDKVITYCNSGNRASVSYFALRLLGADVAVYDGSWLEWGNDPNLPIETGAVPVN